MYYMKKDILPEVYWNGLVRWVEVELFHDYCDCDKLQLIIVIVIIIVIFCGKQLLVTIVFC